MTQGDPVSFNLRVLLFQEGESWVAQGLEHDICAQGDTLSAAVKAFARMLVGESILRAELNLESLSTAMRRAPQEYWARFDDAFTLQVPPQQVPKKPQPVSVAGDYRIAA